VSCGAQGVVGTRKSFPQLHEFLQLLIANLIGTAFAQVWPFPVARRDGGCRFRSLRHVKILWRLAHEKTLGLSYREGRSSDIRAGAVQKCYDTPLGVSIEKDSEKSHKGKMFSFSQEPQSLCELPPIAGYLIEYKQIVRRVTSILRFTKHYR
jgi:hypothetical protein